jgi:zinc transport system substrate-binding protein
MTGSKRAIITLGALLLICLSLVAISCHENGGGAEKLGVVITILPQAEFVERVGGDNVEVTVMVPEGSSPHIYEPTPGQMAKVSEAAMYAKVGSGVEFELVWMDKVIKQNKGMLIVDCSEGVDLIEMVGSHGQEGEVHHQGATDPHIWMSPLNAKVVVDNICEGLKQIDPENDEYYETNRDAYLTELESLHSDIVAGLDAVQNRVFMVYHPSFGYFAKEYDLEMVPVEEEGKEPTAAGLARLIDQAVERDISVVFTSPQFNPQMAQVIADGIGGTVVSVDPLARNYIDSMRVLLSELVQALE